MKIKEIINYEWKKDYGDKSQSKIIKILVYFFILMIVCTIISRFADSLTVSVVKTEKVTSASINKAVSILGIISENKQESISILEGLTIESVNIEKGADIKVGDILFILNNKEVEEKISDIEGELKEKETILSRAKEDYNMALVKEEKNIETALEAMKNSKKALEENHEDLSLNIDELKNNYESNKKSYEEAINNKEINLIPYKRGIEDANYDKEEKKLTTTLNELKVILNNQGGVLSAVEGIVTNVILTEGQQTTGGPAVLLADKKSGYKVVAQLSTDYEKNISLQQKVDLKIEGEEIIEGAINSISRNKENQDILDITILLQEGVGELGKSANIDIINESKRYSNCIPLSAIHSEGNNKYYVLMFDEKETVLGTENVAKKVEVKITDKDGINVALDESSIISTNEVIVDSNKNIEDGDRVRKEEK